MEDKNEFQYVSDDARLMSEWDFEKNSALALDPYHLKYGSNQKAWWICKKGHNWASIISNRTDKNSNCPYCSGRKVIPGENDLTTTHPELIQEWCFDKNEIDPTNVKRGSSIKVWWRCKVCEFEWQASVKNRSLHRRGCPDCANKKRSIAKVVRSIENSGSLLSNNPELSMEWHHKNNLTPDQVSEHSNKKVWWSCHVCGHEWQSVISSRSAGCGCPKCAKRAGTSFPEQAIYYYIKQEYPTTINGYRDVFDNKMELDIYIPELNIGIEYDGEAWHKDENDKNKEKMKYAICKKNKILLIRVREILCDYIDQIADRFVLVPRTSDRNRGLEEVLMKIKEFVPLNQNISIEEDQRKIRESFYNFVGSKSLESCYPNIASEWNYEKNGKITPDMVYAVSGEVFWWKCDAGHEWKSSIANRTKGRKCPFCSGKEVLEGCNDLATIKPQLVNEWNDVLNKGLLPSNVMCGSNKKVWWKCERGHEWMATIYSRAIYGTGCPFCANQKVLSGYNDLLTIRPDLAKQWDYDKNFPLTPNDVLYRSTKKAWWKCEKGHSWYIGIRTRERGNNCPICANKQILIGFNDLGTTNPKLAMEWHPTKNGGLGPMQVTSGFEKKIWWQCSVGHEWLATVSNRNSGHGCPECARRNHKKT